MDMRKELDKKTIVEEIITDTECKSDIRLAVEAMIAEAEQAAQGIGEYYTYKDIFGEETELK